MLRTLPLIKNVIQKEITNLNENPDYCGTIENIENENEIFNYFLTYEIVNQDWFDERLKYTNTELLSELETKLKTIDDFYELHELSDEQLNDEEYIENLLNNYNENK
jgi:enoyl reductase-like protein